MNHRIAHIRKTNVAYDLETIQAYMPSNYMARIINADTIEICGNDVAGWTLTDYVIPRLASGLWFAEELI